MNEIDEKSSLRAEFSNVSVFYCTKNSKQNRVFFVALAPRLHVFTRFLSSFTAFSLHTFSSLRAFSRGSSANFFLFILLNIYILAFNTLEHRMKTVLFLFLHIIAHAAAVVVLAGIFYHLLDVLVVTNVSLPYRPSPPPHRPAIGHNRHYRAARYHSSAAFIAHFYDFIDRIITWRFGNLYNFHRTTKNCLNAIE